MNTEASELYSVYPGEFVPVTDEEKIKAQVKFSEDADFILPSVNIKDLINSYKIQITAPGIERQEFILYADDNLLCVCSRQNENVVSENGSFQRHIVLPPDADTELAIAEYKNNVLCCYIPKTKQPFKHTSTRIIVY